MTDTPLIRRQVTADRGTVLVTTHDVLECIRAMEKEVFSTHEVVAAVCERFEQNANVDFGRLEYAVRQAITWLVKRDYIRKTNDTVKRYTKSHHEPYWATVYIRVEHGAPCDVCLLNRIFFGVEC